MLSSVVFKHFCWFQLFFLLLLVLIFHHGIQLLAILDFICFQQLPCFDLIKPVLVYWKRSYRSLYNFLSKSGSFNSL